MKNSPSTTAAVAEVPDLAAFAQRLADASGVVLMRYFRTDVMVTDKPDSTPVTIADRETERALREMIEAEFPDHGIVGEEYDPVREGAQYVWVIDPLDGTSGFITGKPLFGTLIGCVRDGEPILGVIDHPALGERWIGGVDLPTTLNGEPVGVRSCAKLSKAMLYATSPQMFKGTDAYAFDCLCDAVKRAHYGADCYAYALLALGFVDLVVEASMKPCDFCALAPVVKAAGGVMTDWEGRPLGPSSGDRVIAAGDERVHAQALKLLSTEGEPEQSG